jgi:hypothetical protein
MPRVKKSKIGNDSSGKARCFMLRGAWLGVAIKGSLPVANGRNMQDHDVLALEHVCLLGNRQSEWAAVAH